MKQLVKSFSLNLLKLESISARPIGSSLIAGMMSYWGYLGMFNVIKKSTMKAVRSELEIR